MADPLRVVVLVSGSGSNLQSLIDSVHRPGGEIEIVLVVSSKDGVGPRPRRARGHPDPGGRPRRTRARGARPRAAGVVADARPGLVVLAGWMSMLTGAFLARFPDRVINLHPSLLPAFPGLARDRAGAGGGGPLDRGHRALRRRGGRRRSAHRCRSRYP